MEDIKELVERVLHGDGQAVEELVRRFQRMAVGYAWSMVGDFYEAEDLAQEAFLQALASIGTLQNPAAFPSWFRTILRFGCLRARRGRKGQPLSLDEAEQLAGSPTPEDDLQSREVRDALWRSLDQLSDEDRSVLVLYYFEELTHRQIAAFLGLAESKVNNRLHALRKRLRKECMEIMDYKNQESGDTFRRRVLQGVQKIGYSAGDGTPMLTQFCGSFSAALSAMGANSALDYAFVSAACGAAFRMLWKEGWHPDNVDLCHLHEDAFLPMRLAFEATGCSAEICLCRDSKAAWKEEFYGCRLRTEQEAWEDITASIDRGMPVLALGVIGPPECCVVTGYDEDGRALLGYNYFQEHAQEEGLSIDPDGCFRKRGWYDNTPAYFVLRSIKPVTVDEAAYRSILQRAVDLALTPVSNGRASGLEAYRAWADQLLRDEDDYRDVKAGDGDMNFVGKEGGNADFSADVTGRFGMFCDPFLMVCERANAVRFCERVAQAVPRWQEDLMRAAALYRQVGEDPNPLWQRLGLYDEKQERFRDPDVRGLLAAQVLRRRLLEAQAVACLQEALKK